MTIPAQKKERVWNDPPLEPQKVDLSLHFELKWVGISLAMNTIIAVYAFLSTTGWETATITDIAIYSVVVILYAILMSPLIKWLVEGVLLARKV